MVKNYPLSRNGIFLTIQGEGALLGEPMAFIRLAGCSIGCPHCDTDYAVSERLEARQIADKVAKVMPPKVQWVWITGGEPTDHELAPLLEELRKLGPFIRIALATAGHRTIPFRYQQCGVDWISVSPHRPSDWVQHEGQELKLVPGLNGFHLKDFAPIVFGGKPLAFGHRFVSPCDGKPETVKECVQWVKDHPAWKMTVQAHKLWGLP